MPELPEVETVRRELAPWLAGALVVRARRVEAPAGPKYRNLPRAAGQRILAVERRGKFLLLPLSSGDELVIHLGMTGVLGHERPPQHLRVVLELAESARPTLYFQDARRFGRFLVRRAGEPSGMPTLDRMGPEPFDTAFDDDAFSARLRTTTPIKALLLSQRPVAGVGNIYADEALWRSRIHPLTPARALKRAEVSALRAAVVAVLGESIARQGTTLRDYRTVNGELGTFREELAAYGHGGEPCQRCGTTMLATRAAQRGTVFCPRCQRLRAPRAARR